MGRVPPFPYSGPFSTQSFPLITLRKIAAGGHAAVSAASRHGWGAALTDLRAPSDDGGRPGAPETADAASDAVRSDQPVISVRPGQAPAAEDGHRDGQGAATGTPPAPGPQPRWDAGTPAATLASARAVLSRLAAELTPRALWHRHRLMTIAVTLSLIPRILAALAFRPALLTADSFVYMHDAVTGTLGLVRPGGYPHFLDLFSELPDPLLAVTIAQHLMGIAIAVIVYGLLRYWGLPGWGGCLLALPTLFDSREIALESYILPDTLYCLLVVVAAALLLSRRVPRPWQCGFAALLLAYAAVTRGNGVVLLLVAAAFLFIRRVGWRAISAAAVAFAVPAGGYLLAFHAAYGRFSLTESDGVFLWSRTTSFANCAVIKPPADLRPLCPNLEKSVAAARPAAAWSVSALLHEPGPSAYLWAADAWWRVDAHPGINAYNNALGRAFAERAIEAQPLDYARVVTENVLLTFLTTDRPQGGTYMTFTTAPRIARLPSYYQSDISSYAHTTSNTHAVRPYSYFVLLYQQPIVFPGVVYLLVVLAGLAFVIRDWRRLGGMQLLPWGLAAISILSPALVTQSLYRYTIMAIPLSCLALGLGFATRNSTSRRAPDLAGLTIRQPDGTSARGGDVAARPAAGDL
jgi:hypothetical protein